VIKAQAQNVARNLADTPANLMTPTIFAQVSLMPTYAYVGVSFNSVLQVLEVCLYISHSCNAHRLMMLHGPPHFWTGNAVLFV
jgi:hypothetical protein